MSIAANTTLTLMTGAADTGTGSYTVLQQIVAEAPVDVTSFRAQIAEVEVDPTTGQVTLKKLTTAHDVGTILNPLTYQGRIEGRAVQGVGHALTEHLIVQDRVVTKVHLGDYNCQPAWIFQS